MTTGKATPPAEHWASLASSRLGGAVPMTKPKEVAQHGERPPAGIRTLARQRRVASAHVVVPGCQWQGNSAPGGASWRRCFGCTMLDLAMPFQCWEGKRRCVEWQHRRWRSLELQVAAARCAWLPMVWEKHQHQQTNRHHWSRQSHGPWWIVMATRGKGHQWLEPLDAAGRWPHGWQRSVTRRAGIPATRAHGSPPWRPCLVNGAWTTSELAPGGAGPACTHDSSPWHDHIGVPTPADLGRGEAVLWSQRGLWPTP